MRRTTLILALAFTAAPLAAQVAPPQGRPLQLAPQSTTTSSASDAAERERRAAARRQTATSPSTNLRPTTNPSTTAQPPANTSPPQAGRRSDPPLTLDLGRGGVVQQPTTVQRQGDTFATSGPYASPQQMQRYTGRRTLPMPTAPVNVFSQPQQQNPVWAPQ